jgi:hypothetical protein
MSEPQERSDDHPRDETLIVLADRLMREPEMVAWLSGDEDGDDEPRAA